MNRENFCFNELLKKTLKALNLRYRDLLDLMNVEYYLDQSIVSKWARGVSKPTQKHYNDIVNALYTKVQEVNNKGYTILLDKLMYEVKEYIKVSGLTDETKQHLLNIDEVKSILKASLELSYRLENCSDYDYDNVDVLLPDSNNKIAECNTKSIGLNEVAPTALVCPRQEILRHDSHNITIKIPAFIYNHKKTVLGISCLIVVLSVAIVCLFSFTNKTAKNYYVNAEPVLTFKGLPCGLAGGETGNFIFNEATKKLKEDNARTVQNFYIYRNNIYVTQCIDNNTYLSRCEIMDKGSSKIAICRDYVILDNYGIGESLEINTDGDKECIWVGAAGNAANSNYSTEVRRIEYIKTDNISDTPKLTKLKSVRTLKRMDLATADKSSLGIVKRIAVAIEDGNNKIGFRIELSNGFVYYSIYDLVMLNKYIDTNETTLMSELDFACLPAFRCIEKPNGSFQGYDMTNCDFRKEFHYLAGGNPGEQPMISKISTERNDKNGAYTLESRTIIKDFTLSVQGVKVLNDYLYFALNPGVDEAYSTVLYKIKTP
jgi:transcriptional regulator with XRE-family HTH domain